MIWRYWIEIENARSRAVAEKDESLLQPSCLTKLIWQHVRVASIYPSIQLSPFTSCGRLLGDGAVAEA